jgi:ribosomal protein S1
MVEIGSTIEAAVTRVEHYGVHLDYAGQEVLVLVPEFAWQPVNLANAVRVGDRLKVLVLRYNYKTKQIVGSVRRLHPEQNPYRELSRLPPGVALCGKVTFAATDAVTVRLPNGAWGHLPKRLLAHEVKAGDAVAVEIDAVEVDEGQLTLKPARQNGQAVDGAAGAAPGGTPSRAS